MTAGEARLAFRVDLHPTLYTLHCFKAFWKVFMKILFIDPKVPVFLRVPSVPLGFVSIASYLQAYGHKVKILERSVAKTDIKAELAQFRPDIVGITALSYSSSTDSIKITNYIHATYPGIPVVWGGVGASSMPELYLRDAGRRRSHLEGICRRVGR